MKDAESNEKINIGNENEVRFTTELDSEAFNVILRLYDKTFKELVNR